MVHQPMRAVQQGSGGHVSVSRSVETVTTSVSDKINEIFERENLLERMIKVCVEVMSDPEDKKRLQAVKELRDLLNLGIGLTITKSGGEAKVSKEDLQALVRELDDGDMMNIHDTLKRLDKNFGKTLYGEVGYARRLKAEKAAGGG